MWRLFCEICWQTWTCWWAFPQVFTENSLTGLGAWSENILTLSEWTFDVTYLSQNTVRWNQVFELHLSGEPDQQVERTQILFWVTEFRILIPLCLSNPRLQVILIKIECIICLQFFRYSRGVILAKSPGENTIKKSSLSSLNFPELFLDRTEHQREKI